jgi:hypothetical protein
MRTRTVMMTALVALAGALAACGDDTDSTPPAAEPDATGPSTDEVIELAADGTPSAWYSEPDGLAVPAAGTGTLETGGETIDLTVTCNIAVDNVAYDGVPEQGDEGFMLHRVRELSVAQQRWRNVRTAGTRRWSSDAGSRSSLMKMLRT